MAKRFLVLIALLMLGFYVAGCAEGDESASVVNPNPSALTDQKGSISGVVIDSCTNAPIQGAIVSVGLQRRRALGHHRDHRHVLLRRMSR
jgi:uncharacterized lipoprotein YajG